MTCGDLRREAAAVNAVNTPSASGAISLRSAEMTLARGALKMAWIVSTACQYASPPGTGVPVPGTKDGHNPSTSIVR